MMAPSLLALSRFQKCISKFKLAKSKQGSAPGLRQARGSGGCATPCAAAFAINNNFETLLLFHDSTAEIKNLSPHCWGERFSRFHPIRNRQPVNSNS
jgi:hypothetical protein